MKKEMSDEAYELVTYTDNEGDLYRQRNLPIIANLTRKKAQRKYDRALAAKAFMYIPAKYQPKTAPTKRARRR